MGMHDEQRKRYKIDVSDTISQAPKETATLPVLQLHPW